MNRNPANDKKNCVEQTAKHIYHAQIETTR